MAVVDPHSAPSVDTGRLEMEPSTHKVLSLQVSTPIEENMEIVNYYAETVRDRGALLVDQRYQFSHPHHKKVI